jgi:hypothetical protein
MRARWARFRANVPGWEAAKTLLFFAVFAALALLYFKGADRAAAVLTLVVSFLAPYLVRGWLVDRLELFERVSRAVPLAMAVVTGVLGKALKRNPEALFVLVVALGVYAGAYFWVFSDERLEPAARPDGEGERAFWR